MNKAYIILAHRKPEQLQRLIQRLDDGLSVFFVHIDKRVSAAVFQILNKFGTKAQLVDAVASKWASFGQIQGILNALKAVKNHSMEFDVVNLLSGQDYLLKSKSHHDVFFVNAEHTVFTDYFLLPIMRNGKT